MQSEAHLVNSAHTCEAFISRVRDLYDANKYVVFKWKIGKDRTVDQNALSFAYYRELERQAAEGDADYYRATCKLRFGMPIICEDAETAERVAMLKKYAFSYEDKLAIMLEPYDFPVTRLMVREQFSRYIEKIEQHWPTVDFRGAKRVNGYE